MIAYIVDIRQGRSTDFFIVDRLVNESGGRALSFQWDGAIAYFTGDAAPETAVSVAFQLLETIRTLPRYEIHVRIAIGVDDLPDHADFSKSSSYRFNLAGHAEKYCSRGKRFLTNPSHIARIGKKIERQEPLICANRR